MAAANKFARLLAAANDVLSGWLEDGAQHNPAMIELHCAARALDAYQVQQEIAAGQGRDEESR